LKFDGKIVKHQKNASGARTKQKARVF